MTKYRNVVITGGISIMNKNNQFGNYFLDFNSKNCKFENAEEIFQNILKEKELTDKKIKELVLEKPHNVSAEFSMLKGLENEDLLDDFISVSIIHSETVEGKLSALMNKKIIESIYGAEVSLKNVFRCAYHFSRDEQILYIYEIWLSHDEYEKDCDLIKKGKKSLNMNKSEMFDLGYNS